MAEELILRGLALLVCTLPLLLLLQRLWRELGPGSRLVLGFTLGLYSLTYLAGTALLFLGREALIGHYFSESVVPPYAAPYAALLGLALLPLPLLALAVWLCRRRSPELKATTENASDGGWPALLALLLVLVLALLLTRGMVAELLANALTGLGQTEGLADLYARRMAAFETMSMVQGGMIYGVIPACAALLLFQRRPILRWLGLPAAMLTLLLNLGLFQIGTLLAFGLTLLMCGLVLSTPVQIRRRLAIATVAGMAVFALYQGLKEDQASSPVIQLLLRMPIALPFLWQFSQEAPQDLAISDSLPHDLGEFMFPELRQPDRFVAMPQPAFVAAFFQHGLTASLAVLLLIGLSAGLIGRLLDGLQQRTHRIWIAVAFTPALYYAFQVSLVEVLLSSYGVVFSALPVLAALAARSLSIKKIS